MDLGRPLRFPKNDLGIPPRSFVYSGQPNPLLGFAPHLYRGGMLSVGHDFQPGMHPGVVPGGAFQAGKFSGEEPTPGGPTQQGAAAQGAGPGAGEGETPGGGIETSADQAFSTAKSLVQAAQALTTSAPTTSTAPTGGTTTAAPQSSPADLSALAPSAPSTAPAPESGPQPPLGTPEPEEAFPGASMTPTARLSQPIGAPQTRPQPPMGVPEPEEAMPGATINLGSPMNLGAPPQVPAVTPTETTTQQKQNELPQMGAGAAGAAAAGAGIAAGTSAPGAPAPAQPGAATIGSTAGPATASMPTAPGAPEGVEFNSNLGARAAAPAPTGVSAEGGLTDQGSTVDTALSGAKGGLNLGSGVFDLIRGNVPTGIAEVAGSAPGLAKVAGAVTGTDLTGGTAGQAVAGSAGAIAGAAGLAKAIQGNDPAGAIKAALSTAQGANTLLQLRNAGIAGVSDIIATYLPLINLGIGIGTRSPGGTIAAAGDIGAEIASGLAKGAFSGASGATGVSTIGALGAPAAGTAAGDAAGVGAGTALAGSGAGVAGGAVGGEVGGAAAASGAGGAAAGSSAGGATAGAAGGLAAGAASAILAIVPIVAQWWGSERDATKVSWDIKEGKKQLAAFHADPTVARTGIDLAEFETTGSDASMMAIAHDLQAAVYTAAKGSEYMGDKGLAAGYIGPLLKFASKSPRYGDLLAAAYKLGAGPNFTDAGSREANILRAFDGFKNMGAPIPKEVVSMLPGYTPLTGQQETMAQGTPTGRLAGSDPYAAYRAQPTALEMDVRGGGAGWPNVAGAGPRTIPVDANGMVEVTVPVNRGQLGTDYVRTKMPWQQATSMNLGAMWQTSMAQGTPTGGGYYPVRAIYAPGQSPFVNVAEPMAPPPPPPPAPLPAAPARVPVNLGGPGPFPSGSSTPGANTGLTAEQRRALMFQVA